MHCALWICGLVFDFSIVPKCSQETSAPVPKCRNSSDMPKCPRSEFRKVRSVLGPKCPRSELSIHLIYSKRLKDNSRTRLTLCSVSIPLEIPLSPDLPCSTRQYTTRLVSLFIIYRNQCETPDQQTTRQSFRMTDDINIHHTFSAVTLQR